MTIISNYRCFLAEVYSLIQNIWDDLSLIIVALNGWKKVLCGDLGNGTKIVNCTSDTSHYHRVLLINCLCVYIEGHSKTT